MRLAIAALTFLLPLTAHASHDGLPLQIDVSGGSNELVGEPAEGDGSDVTPPTSASVAALWVSAVVPLVPDRTWRRPGGFFIAPGGEVTVDGEHGPYSWSTGAGMRFGFAFRGHLEAVPDAILFVRATPFIGMRSVADEDYLGEREGTLTRRGYGMRLGVGFTAPLWSATVWRGIASSNLDGADFSGLSGFNGDPRGLLVCCLFGAAVILLNHVELTWETYNEPGPPAINRVGIRLGTGF